MKPLSAKVCFVMDCTASMEPWLRMARNEILNIIDYVEERHPYADIAVAFVGYRDHGDANRLLIHPFSDVPPLMNFLNTVQAMGGDDIAEDVAGALQHVHTLDWSRTDVAMIYHIADAPAHGLRFHNEDISDSYPEGDPFGLDPATSLRQFARNGVHYTFVRITRHTDKMTDIFANVYRGGPGRFHVIDMAGRSRHTLTQEIYTSMDQTLTQYTASQGLEGV
jgi:hypothetical protein